MTRGTKKPNQSQEPRPCNVVWRGVKPAALGQNAEEACGVEVKTFGELARRHRCNEADCKIDLGITKIALTVIVQQVKEVTRFTVRALGKGAEQLCECMFVQRIRWAEGLWPQQSELSGWGRRRQASSTVCKHSLIPLLEGDKALLGVQEVERAALVRVWLLPGAGCDGPRALHGAVTGSVAAASRAGDLPPARGGASRANW
mmetsp:Transcript_102785/g.299792  ORF Transcript_102785/g.299792 Transcript_102785/m.299792 type:complete len:202 (+) Transcript_102785:298-903(+)